MLLSKLQRCEKNISFSVTLLIYEYDFQKYTTAKLSEKTSKQLAFEERVQWLETSEVS